MRYSSFLTDSGRWEGFDLRPDDIIIATPAKCGTTWTQMDTPTTGGQGEVHFSIAANPTNSMLVYVGGQAGALSRECCARARQSVHFHRWFRRR